MHSYRVAATAPLGALLLFAAAGPLAAADLVFSTLQDVVGLDGRCSPASASASRAATRT